VQSQSVLIINAMLQVLAAASHLNAGEANDKICTVRPLTGEPGKEKEVADFLRSADPW